MNGGKSSIVFLPIVFLPILITIHHYLQWCRLNLFSHLVMTHHVIRVYLYFNDNVRTILHYFWTNLIYCNVKRGKRHQIFMQYVVIFMFILHTKLSCWLNMWWTFLSNRVALFELGILQHVNVTCNIQLCTFTTCVTTT